MASGKPSLITGNKNSEVANIFKSNHVGSFFSENDSLKIYEKICEFKNNPELSRKYGKRTKVCLGQFL